MLQGLWCSSSPRVHAALHLVYSTVNFRTIFKLFLLFLFRLKPEAPTLDAMVSFCVFSILDGLDSLRNV